MSRPRSTASVAARTQADTEFLAREIAGVRLALGDAVTNEDLKEHLERLTKVVERLAVRLDGDPGSTRRPVGASPARPRRRLTISGSRRRFRGDRGGGRRG